MLTVEELAARHQEHSPFLAGRPRRFVLLWYADRGVEVRAEDQVRYHCPVCGKLQTLPLEEFLELESDVDMRCSACRAAQRTGGAKN
jgi:hypothetical protein